MPIVDRKFVGLLLMITIASIALGSIIFARWAGSEYTILSNDYPKDPKGRGYMPTTGETDRFLISVLVSRPLEEMTVEFAYLANTSYRPAEELPEGWDQMDPTQRARYVGSIPYILNRTGEFGGISWSTRIFDLHWGDKKYRLVLFDFSNLTLWAGRNGSTVACLQGVLFDEEGEIAGYFPGRRDFLGYDGAVQRIFVERSGERVEYAPVSKGVQPPGTTPLKKAPPFGRVNFTDLRKDEIVSVGLEVNPAALGSAEYIYILDLKVNGEDRESFVHLLRRESR